MPNVVYIVALGTTRKSRTKFNNYSMAYRDPNVKLMNKAFIPEELFEQINCSIIRLSHYMWF
jgi:hypothetical protein